MYEGMMYVLYNMYAIRNHSYTYHDGNANLHYLVRPRKILHKLKKKRGNM